MASSSKVSFRTAVGSSHNPEKRPSIKSTSSSVKSMLSHENKSKQTHFLRMILIISLPNSVAFGFAIFFLARNNQILSTWKHEMVHLEHFHSLLDSLNMILKERGLAFRKVNEKLGGNRMLELNYLEQIIKTDNAVEYLGELKDNTEERLSIIRRNMIGLKPLDLLMLYNDVLSHLVRAVPVHSLKVDQNVWGNLSTMIVMFNYEDARNQQLSYGASFLTFCLDEGSMTYQYRILQGIVDSMYSYARSLDKNVDRFMSEEARVYTLSMSRINQFNSHILLGNVSICKSLGALESVEQKDEWVYLMSHHVDRIWGLVIQKLQVALSEQSIRLDKQHNWVGIYIAVLVLIICLATVTIIWYVKQVNLSLSTISGITYRIVNKKKSVEEEKRRADKLLFRMIPRTIANELKEGNNVPPKVFQCVSILFTDINDFEEICTMSRPIEIITFLNKLYNQFDEQLERFDVYKVETISDSYMVASGLPEPNGDRHSWEIAELALSLSSCAKDFQIPHLSGRRLLIKLGVHSGEVVAGVIGNLMPHYCLFGDSVNVASRMKTHSEPLKIHVSKPFVEILQTFNQHIITYRGVVDVKGKGPMPTYWLTGRKATEGKRVTASDIKDEKIVE